MTALKPFGDARIHLLGTTLPACTASRVASLGWLLRFATAGTFMGHGAYGALMVKPGWYDFFSQLGFAPATMDAWALPQLVGGFEMVLGAFALAAPVRLLLLSLFVWKLGTEFVWYPLADKPAWEFVERASNYVAPLALLLVRGWPHELRDWFR